MLVCFFVCLFSIQIQTDGQIGMKFGMEAVLEGGRFLGAFQPYSPHPRGPGCLWSLNRAFCCPSYPDPQGSGGLKGGPGGILEPQGCILAKAVFFFAKQFINFQKRDIENTINKSLHTFNKY